eukprot:11244611-Alexandrium_andersonii.AAC.1
MGGEPAPSRTRLRSKPRRLPERSSHTPAIRPTLKSPNWRAQPCGRRASRCPPKAWCRNWG